ncbi:hypothetical protein GCM10009712_41130 [Pseudarthrobacter sulfonivorans]
MSAHAPTLPIDPVRRWCRSDSTNRRDRNGPSTECIRFRPRFFGDTDQMPWSLHAQALDPVLARRDALLRELVGIETVPECRVVGVDVQGGVDEVRIDPLPFCHRTGPPPLIALLAELQHPAGHRHGNTIGGKIRDQRVAL